MKLDSEILKNAGIDFEKGVTRFLGDRQLFERILITFLKDATFARGKEALEQQDYNNLYERIHTLKGVAGNTDMTQLYQRSGTLCDYLKTCDVPDVAVVNSLFQELEEAYQSVFEGILSAKEV